MNKYPDFNPEMTALILDHPDLVKLAFENCESVANNRMYDVQPSPSPVKVIHGLLGGGKKSKKSSKSKPMRLIEQDDSESDSDMETAPQTEQDRRRNHNVTSSSTVNLDIAISPPKTDISKAQKIKNVQQGTGI